MIQAYRQKHFTGVQADTDRQIFNMFSFSHAMNYINEFLSPCLPAPQQTNKQTNKQACIHSFIHAGMRDKLDKTC